MTVQCLARLRDGGGRCQRQGDPYCLHHSERRNDLVKLTERYNRMTVKELKLALRNRRISGWSGLRTKGECVTWLLANDGFPLEEQIEATQYAMRNHP